MNLLGARPRNLHPVRVPLGLQPLEISKSRDGLLYVPASYLPERPAPLLVLLHGAGGNAQHGLVPMLDLADRGGYLLLAPESRGRTWDMILGGFGPDVEFIDEALELVFERYAVNGDRVVLGGFSDGASYALSLGLTNGDLFNYLVAFSPGFMAPEERQGSPRIFVSHGTRDPVLPIDSCSRRIVPRLERLGYDVTYVEFEGGHAVPLEIAREALQWLGERN